MMQMLRRFGATALCAAAVTILLVLGQSAGAETMHVYFGNLHSHTSYSDGSGKPNDAYKHAKEKAKLDFLAVTEHNHSKAESGAKERADGKLIATDHSLYNGSQSSSVISAANKWNKDGEFVAIFGQEFSTISSGNHIIVYEVPQVIDVPNGAFDKLINEWLPQHPPAGGGVTLIQFNHPDDFRDYSKEYGADDFGTLATWITAMDAHAELFELLNGPAMAKVAPPVRSSDVSQTEYLHYLNLGFHLGPTGDQDNHYKTWGTTTDSRTGVVASELTKPAILEALRQRRVYATEDKNLRAIFRVNDHLCGDRVSTVPTAHSKLEVELTLTDDDEPDAEYQVEVYSDEGFGGPEAEPIETVRLTGNSPASVPHRLEDIEYVGGSQYLFFKITQFSEHGLNDRLWTAPVWFESAPSVAAAPDPSTCVASKRSDVYHVSDQCRDAQRISPANRVTGQDAVQGRRLHEGCPR